MSQFTFTPAEDLLVLNCVRAKAAQFLSAYGVEDADLVALMAKIESQFTPVVVEPAPVATPVVEDEVAVEATQEAEAEEKPAKAKKAK
jgi:hypothetical protein